MLYFKIFLFVLVLLFGNIHAKICPNVASNTTVDCTQCYIAGTLYLKDLIGITIKNCKFSIDSAIVMESSQDIQIVNNEFSGSNIASSINAIDSERITIKGNNFKIDSGADGSYMHIIHVDGSESIQIASNSFSGISGPPTSDVAAIYIFSSINCDISSNSIHGITRANADTSDNNGLTYGISLWSSNNVSVVNNSISAIRGVATTYYAHAAIAIYAVSINNVTISSNHIEDITGGDLIGKTGNAGNGYGVRIDAGGPGNVMVAQNTITNINGGSGGNGGSATAIQIFRITGNTTVANNIINEITGGSVGTNFGITKGGNAYAIDLEYLTSVTLYKNEIDSVISGNAGWTSSESHPGDTIGVLCIQVLNFNLIAFNTFLNLEYGQTAYIGNNQLTPPTYLCNVDASVCPNFGTEMGSDGSACYPNTECCISCQYQTNRICRDANGLCDKTETCDESTASDLSCPVDVLLNNTYCGIVGGPCRTAGICNGTSRECTSAAKEDGDFCQDGACNVGTCEGGKCEIVGKCEKAGSGQCRADSICYCDNFPANSTLCSVPPGCSNSTASCSLNANCVLVGQDYACVCASRFSGDGYTCTQLIGCAGCGNNTQCVQGRCLCAPGFTARTTDCVDIDECLNTSSCPLDAQCSNLPGGYLCTCPPGFYMERQGKNSVCVFLGFPCNSSQDCGAHSTCDYWNGLSNYVTTCQCDGGYNSSTGANCKDIDECSDPSDFDCPQHSACVNTDGAFRCECSAGYQNAGPVCTDVNECLQSPCTKYSVCNNTDGGYTCKCVPGFTTQKNGSCKDINECDAKQIQIVAICGKAATCLNTIGSYNCTCKSGFYLNSTDEDCYDINECASSPLCASGKFCFNEPGSFVCATCPPGFAFDPLGNCVDINECLTRNGNCDYQVSCTNTNGSRMCGFCPPGTFGEGEIECLSYCGDGVCNATILENCISCAADCRSPCGLCGDGFCNSSIFENCSSCAKDCGSCKILSCPGTPTCSGHGACDSASGRCVCSGNWTGSKCQSDTAPIFVVVPPASVGVQVAPQGSDSHSFSLALSLLQERSPFGTVIFSVNLTDANYTFTQVTPQNNTLNQQWVFNITLENNAILFVTVWHFLDVLTSVQFANKSTNYTANSIKLEVSVFAWPFRSVQNTLALTFATQSHGTRASDCVSIDSASDASGSLQWISLQYNNVTMYGQFEQVAEVDGVARKISFSLNDDYSVTATVPHFWNLVYLDPSYNVLLDKYQPDATGQCGDSVIQSKSTKIDLLLVEILVPVVAGLAIFAIVFWALLYPKIKARFQVRQAGIDNKMQMISSTDFMTSTM